MARRGQSNREQGYRLAQAITMCPSTPTPLMELRVERPDSIRSANASASVRNYEPNVLNQSVGWRFTKRSS